MQYDDVTANPIWRTAAILKIVFWLYLNESINVKFCRIKQNLILTQAAWPKYQISKIHDGGRPPYWKSSFGYISTNDYPINAKFCRIKQNHVITQVQNTNIPNFENSRWRMAAILKMVVSLYFGRKSSDLIEIWYADADFAFKVRYLTKS